MEHESVESLRRWLREKDDEVAIFKRTLDKRDAEIERLRGLLQWWIDAGPDADWDDYEQRVLKEIRNAR